MKILTPQVSEKKTNRPECAIHDFTHIYGVEGKKRLLIRNNVIKLHIINCQNNKLV